MSTFRDREVLFTERLVENAGIDPLQDKFYVGYLAACRDILKMDVTEIKDHIFQEEEFE